MKNIQIVDGANNAEYAIFSASEADFAAIFPFADQDIELVEDFIARAGADESQRVLRDLWESPVDKKSVQGIHGTLFFDAEPRRDSFPATRREADWQGHTIDRLTRS